MKKNSKVLEREIAGEAVLLNVDSGNYIVLNRTGSFIWARLSSLGPREIVDELCRQFSVGNDLAEDGLNRFIGELAKEGMVEGDRQDTREFPECR